MLTPTYLLTVYVAPADTPNDNCCPTVCESLPVTCVSVTALAFALTFTVLARLAMMPVPSVWMVSQSRCAAASKPLAMPVVSVAGAPSIRSVTVAVPLHRGMSCRRTTAASGRARSVNTS